MEALIYGFLGGVAGALVMKVCVVWPLQRRCRNQWAYIRALERNAPAEER